MYRSKQNQTSWCRIGSNQYQFFWFGDLEIISILSNHCKNQNEHVLHMYNIYHQHSSSPNVLIQGISGALFVWDIHCGFTHGQSWAQEKTSCCWFVYIHIYIYIRTYPYISIHIHTDPYLRLGAALRSKLRSPHVVSFGGDVELETSNEL